MRYLTQPKFRKYVRGYGFLSFARKFGDKEKEKEKEEEEICIPPQKR